MSMTAQLRSSRVRVVLLSTAGLLPVLALRQWVDQRLTPDSIVCICIIHCDLCVAEVWGKWTWRLPLTETDFHTSKGEEDTKQRTKGLHFKHWDIRVRVVQVIKICFPQPSYKFPYLLVDKHFFEKWNKICSTKQSITRTSQCGPGTKNLKSISNKK